MASAPTDIPTIPTTYAGIVDSNPARWNLTKMTTILQLDVLRAALEIKAQINLQNQPQWEHSCPALLHFRVI